MIGESIYFSDFPCKYCYQYSVTWYIPEGSNTEIYYCDSCKKNQFPDYEENLEWLKKQIISSK